MKKFTSLLLVCLVIGGTSFLTGCGSSNLSSNANLNLVVTFARAGARVGLAVEFKKHGVSDEDSAAILAELHTLGDQLLAGKDIRTIVSDPATWAVARAAALPKLGAIIAKVKVSGVPLYDVATANDMAGALLDAFASIIQELPKPAPITVPTTAT